MSQDHRTIDQLNVILEKRPAFIIRWGLVVFCVIVMALLLVTYYAGYSVLNILSITH
jgi:hypothetical protein